MLKDYIKGIGFVTLILMFFYFCGTLYLVGFWTTFDIDVSNFIGLSDIPKNFVYPFIITSSIALSYAFLHGYTIGNIKYKRSDKDNAKTITINPIVVKVIQVIFLSNILLLLYFLVFFVLFFEFKYSYDYWLILCGSTFILLFVRLIRLPTMKDFITDSNLISHFKLFILLFPMLCFITGKLKSLRIYRNDEIRIIKSIKNNKSELIADSTTYKLLDFLGDKTIVSTVDNKKILILNQSAYEGLILDSVIKNANKKIKSPQEQKTKDTTSIHGK